MKRVLHQLWHSRPPLKRPRRDLTTMPSKDSFAAQMASHISLLTQVSHYAMAMPAMSCTQPLASFTSLVGLAMLVQSMSRLLPRRLSLNRRRLSLMSPLLGACSGLALLGQLLPCLSLKMEPFWRRTPISQSPLANQFST